MKYINKLNDGWTVKKIEPAEKLSIEQLQELEKASDSEWLKTDIPAEIHEILLKEGIIDELCFTGKTEQYLWVTEKDWVYKTTFAKPELSKKLYLHFKGLDTLVDIYLNGKHIAHHSSMFLPLKIEVTSLVNEKNVLLLHFHSANVFLKEHGLRTEYLRKTGCDFGDYTGPKPYLTPIGVFGDIQLESVDAVEITGFDIRPVLECGYEKADVTVNLTVEGFADEGELVVSLRDPEGKTLVTKSCPVKGIAGNKYCVETLKIDVDNPKLWWPRGYGNQPLYKLKASIFCGGEERDSAEKQIGFRDIKILDTFEIIFNNKRITVWGANWTPVDAITHRWNREMAFTLLDMAENANMNILRVWGGGEPYDDEFYAEADKRGILLWQEFYYVLSSYYETEEFKDLSRKECENMVKSLKHHPSILLWCGGNEAYQDEDFKDDTKWSGKVYMAHDLFEKDFKEICRRLDPDRFYWVNSPWGGKFSNDPAEGDTHSYTNTFYVPGASYPVLVTENMRTSPPSLKSLKKFMGEENIYPQGYKGLVTKVNKLPWPQTWEDRCTCYGWKKIGRVGRYPDADDKESLVYRFAAAHGQYFKETVEMYRRGRPSSDTHGKRICNGHIVWKFNSSFAQIYSGLVDYYLEPYIPYYAIKRAYEPILISFDIGEHIYVWVVNDSPLYTEGTVVVQVYDPEKNEVLLETKKDTFVQSGESKVIMDLDEFGQFWRHNILYAYFIGKDGKMISRNDEILNYERYMNFPDARLELDISADNTITLTTDRFARCVELSGNEDGDEFGWMFEDNYFDLLPGEVKKVKIMGKHRKGVVSAKAYYSSSATCVTL